MFQLNKWEVRKWRHQHTELLPVLVAEERKKSGGRLRSRVGEVFLFFFFLFSPEE